MGNLAFNTENSDAFNTTKKIKKKLPPSQMKRRPDLTNLERHDVVQWLMHHSSNQKLHHGAKGEAVLLFKIDVKTIWRIWKSASIQIALGVPVSVISKKRGAKHKDKKLFDAEKIKALPLLQRQTIRKLALNLGVSKRLVQEWLKDHKVKARTSAIKPFLTPKNMLTRLLFSLNQLRNISAGGKINFKPMFNIIHVDQKWFNLTKEKGRYYLVDGEEQPHRTCKSKQHIDKIMFMCMVSRPIFDSDGNMLFDGKFAIIPFIYVEPAKRNSKNRPKGTMVTKAIQNISREVIKATFLQQMIPIIKEKAPSILGKHIIIQQDNAKPHFSNNDPDFRAAATADGWDIELICQPANSPDTNINDLGFFRAIQSLKDEKMAVTVDDMIKNVKEAFEEFEPWKLNNAFLTLQGCHHEIIKNKGNNNYSLPHMGKEKLARLDMLPDCLQVDEQLMKDSWDYLRENGIQQEQEPTLNNDNILDGLEQLGLQD